MPVTIDVDDPIVGDLLASTLELIAQAGGWVHPSARLVARSGHLHVEAAVDDGRPLASIPASACVRVDAVAWDDSDDHLAIAGVPDDIGDLELPMLYLQTALHNQCGKLPWLRAAHPAVAPGLREATVAAVQRIEPGFRATPMSLRDLLFANRCFRLALSDDGAPQRVLVPIVDLLDHHAQGASGQWDGFAFTVPMSRPTPPECSLDYGLQRDAIEMAAVYGFADASAHVVHSAPVHMDVPGVGTVVVTREQRAAGGTLQSMRADVIASGIQLNRLTFGPKGVDEVAAQIAGATGLSAAASAAVAAAALDENRRLLAVLVDTARSDAPSPAAQVLADAAEHSLGLLDVGAS